MFRREWENWLGYRCFFIIWEKKKIKIELSRSSKVKKVQFRYGRGYSIVTQIQSVMHRL